MSEAARRRPLLAFGTPALVVAATVLFVLWVPPVYQATTDIRIDEERSGVAVLQILQTLSRGSEVHTEMAVLRSRSLAEDVTEELALQLALREPARTPRSRILSALRVDLSAPEATYTLERAAPGRYRVTAELVLPGEMGRPFARARRETRELGEALVGVPARLDGVRVTLAPTAEPHARIVFYVAAFDDAVKKLQDALVVSRPNREANVVRVRHVGRDPELVREVLNRVAENFINRRQGVQSAEVRGTVSFLEEQLDSLERQLGDSEEELRRFRESHRIVSLEEEAGAQMRRLAEMQAQRDLMEMERSPLAQLMDEVRAEVEEERGAQVGEAPAPRAGARSYRRLLAFPSLLRIPVTGELLSQLATLENELSEVLRVRTPEDRDVQLVQERIDQLDAQLRATAETYLASLDNQVTSFDAALGTFQNELARIPTAQMTFVRLRRQVDLLSEIYTELQMRRKEAEIVAAVDDLSVRIVDPAIYPREPVRPRPWLSVFMALLVGSVMGMGGALAAEHRDRSVRDRRDVGRVTGSAVLGLIPRLRDVARVNGSRLPVPWNQRPSALRPRLVERISAGDPAVEAYRSLRTNLLFSRIEQPPGVVVFTSPMPGDGKSTTAANLALVLAQQGHRILLIDADMRRGLLHEVVGSVREPGLSEVLFAKVPLAAALAPVEPHEGVKLDFLPSGIWPPNPAELIASSRMRELLDEVRRSYEMVILDAPPLNLVTDAALLGTHCDGVILVARAGVTEEGPLEFAVEQLQKVRAPLLGTVLNGVSQAGQDYYGSRGRGARAYFGKG